MDDDPPVARDDYDLWIPVVVRRVLLAVAANEIIIGGLSHSSSTAAWLSGWLFGDGAVTAAVATAAVAVATAAVGVVFHPLATVGDEGARVTGSAACGRARAREAEDERGG